MLSQGSLFVKFRCQPQGQNTGNERDHKGDVDLSI